MLSVINSRNSYNAYILMVPGKVISEEYSLEYGTDTMEMHVGAVEAGERALVIDDLIATGGTLGAAIKLLGVYLIMSLLYGQVFIASFFFYQTISALTFFFFYFDGNLVVL